MIKTSLLMLTFSLLSTFALANNQKPKQAFSEFQSFELAATTLGEPYKGNEANEKSRSNMDNNFDSTLAPTLKEWTKSEGGKTLVVQAHIKGLRFIGTAARIGFGAMAGSSWVVLEVKFTDKETGELVASALFFRSAKGNGFTGSRADYRMLEVLAEDVASYMKSNYASAVGGTGQGIYPAPKFIANSKG